MLITLWLCTIGSFIFDWVVGSAGFVHNNRDPIAIIIELEDGASPAWWLLGIGATLISDSIIVRFTSIYHLDEEC